MGTRTIQPPANALAIAREGSFYVPSFEIRLKASGGAPKGEKLPASIVRDVTQVTYKDNVNEIDSFELTINNWDATTRDFKYTGLEGTEPDDAPRLRFLKTFDPGKQLELWMGYAGQLRLMMTGEITTSEPTFPASGAPTLAVRGLNILHQLRRKKQTDYWPKEANAPGIRDSDVAKAIATALDGKAKRFPMAIRVHPAPNEPLRPRVFQKDEYDIVFLLSLARRNGYVVFVKEVNDQGQPDKHLYFGPSDGSQRGERNVLYILEWGKSLIQFKPTLTTAKQVGSVTVRGWDRKTKKPIEVTVKWTDKEVGINRDLGEIEQAFNQREEFIADHPISSQAEAKSMAVDFLKNRLKEMVKGSGSTVGLPDLRAGRNVFIAGLGNRFSGNYFITETTHTINDNGYLTTFNARREEEGAKS
jgi:phage protein D